MTEEQNYSFIDGRMNNPIDRMMEKLSRELSKKDKEKLLPIVEYLKKHDTITRKIAEQLTGKSGATANRYLNMLGELGILETDGQSVTTTYRRK